MRELRIHRGAIKPLQCGMLRRHRYYQALGNARSYRLLKSRTAGYRELNRQWRAKHGPVTAEQREALYVLARRDRAMAERLSQWGQRFQSVNDPIDAEIYRIRCELYCALAAGEGAETAFQSHAERAHAACERFNARQDAILKQVGRRDWHPTTTGYLTPDESWHRLRHAVQMFAWIRDGQPLPMATRS